MSLCPGPVWLISVWVFLQPIAMTTRIVTRLVLHCVCVCEYVGLQLSVLTTRVSSRMRLHYVLWGILVCVCEDVC